MPKLLHINTTLNRGSTGRIVEQIAQRAQNSGWENYVAYGGRYIGKSMFNTIQVSSRWDNYLHAFEGEFLGRHGLGSVASTKRFLHKVQELKPDIIHLHNIHGYYINYRLLFEYLSGSRIPVVWTLHDCWAFTGHCTHFERIGCEKWKTECAHCPLMMAQYKSRFVDRSRKNFLLKKQLYGNLSNVFLVPVSQWLGNLVTHSILGKLPMKVIHNGVDVGIFKPTASNIRERFSIPKEKAIVLGVLGSGSGNEKGRREFIGLSHRDDVQLILVGLTSNDAKAFPDSIIKIGRIDSQQELAEYYSAANLFLNPTYNDTFPTVNLESLSCGTPIVTYRTGGSPESITQDTGVVVEQGNYYELNNAIDRVIANGKESYSKACRERAISNFNKNECFDEYLNLYRDLLCKNHDVVESWC